MPQSFFFVYIWGEAKLSVTNKKKISFHNTKKKYYVCENREKKLYARETEMQLRFFLFSIFSTRHEHDFLMPTCYEKSCDTTEKCVIQCEMMRIFRCSLAIEFSSLFHTIFLSLSMWIGCWNNHRAWCCCWKASFKDFQTFLPPFFFMILFVAGIVEFFSLFRKFLNFLTSLKCKCCCLSSFYCQSCIKLWLYGHVIIGICSPVIWVCTKSL